MSVEVGRFHDLHEAELAAGLLRSAGIRAEVADHFLIAANPLMQRAVGGLRVMTPSRQAEDARAILARVQAGEFATDEPDDLPAVRPAPARDLGLMLSILVLPELTAGMLGARRGLSIRRRFAPLAMTALLVFLILTPLILLNLA